MNQSISWIHKTNSKIPEEDHSHTWHVFKKHAQKHGDIRTSSPNHRAALQAPPLIM